MSATFFPSINNRMDRSVPKFGARCTINRPVGCPLGDVVGPPWDGVAVPTVSVAETRTAKTAAENGDAALARLDSGLERYDVIIVDQKMPHMTGVELVGELRKRRIASKIMVLSAYLSSDVRADYERMDVHVMFPKPFDVGQLRTAVDQLAA